MLRKWGMFFILAVVFLFQGSAEAVMIDITDPALQHFTSFGNEAITTQISAAPATTYGDFGWHTHSTQIGYAFPEYAGSLFTSSYAVTQLSFQVHGNPLRDFVLQGSSDTTTGLDGNWSDIFTGRVDNRSEMTWSSWEFSNSNFYNAYRVKIVDSYLENGWAMYRWELMADNSLIPTTATPEPASMLLFGLGGAGLAFMRRRHFLSKV